MCDKNNIKYLLMLINKTIHADMAAPDEMPEADWKKIYALASKNKLVPLLYNTVQSCSLRYGIPDNLMALWKKSALFELIAESRKYNMLRQILKLAAQRDITIILFKGYILADLYPNYLARTSADTDVFVYERDKEKAVKLFEDMGFRKSTISSKETVYNYILDTIHYMVELHFSLWEDFKSSKINLLENMQLTKEETLVGMKICDGMEIMTLGYEEHLIYQIYHIIKHFSLQGVGIRYLTDITLYINRYLDRIDIDRFWRKMELLKYDIFCGNFLNICIRYFGMSPRILEGRKVELISNMDVFLTDLLNIGPCFEERSANWHLVGIMKPYFLGEQDIPKSKLIRKLKILFPERKVFPIAYARKHIFLLPVGWVHRCIHFLAMLPKNNRELADAKEKMYLAEIRLSLMQNLGLTDGGKK